MAINSIWEQFSLLPLIEVLSRHGSLCLLSANDFCHQLDCAWVVALPASFEAVGLACQLELCHAVILLASFEAKDFFHVLKPFSAS